MDINCIENEYITYERKIANAEISFLYGAPRIAEEKILHVIKTINKNMEILR